jgi:5-methylcytosine-specific restriction enzyme subunit McrC
MKIIELTEYQSIFIPRSAIPPILKQEIEQNYPSQVKITLQDTIEGDQWKITAQGWVGHIPLTSEITLKLNPKVPIENLLGMLEYAYNLKSFRFLDGVTKCDSLRAYGDRLAKILTESILDRTRQGLYGTYVENQQNYRYIRGKIDFKSHLKKNWQVALKCHYQEYTRDIGDNQILLWTLNQILKTGICSAFVRHLVRKAYHALQGSVTLTPFTTKDCIGRKYNRLNQDYQLLHSLCRFFLDLSTPTHKEGDSQMRPFLVDMAQLYERFVAEWLKVHLPKTLYLKSQARVQIGETLQFRIDLVIYDQATNQAIYVLDTKYKLTAKPSNIDFNQVVTNSISQNCPEAILIYPYPLEQSLDLIIGKIRVRSLIFSLEGDLDTAGNLFLENLFQNRKTIIP